MLAAQSAQQPAERSNNVAGSEAINVSRGRYVKPSERCHGKCAFLSVGFQKIEKYLRRESYFHSFEADEI